MTLTRTGPPKRRTRLRRLGAAVTRKRTKYGNTPRIYNGIEYHSQKEAGYAMELDLRMRSARLVDGIRSWRRQVPVKLEVNGMLVTTYIVDFVVLYRDEREEWVEVKGFETPEWKIKEKLFRALFPDRKLTVVR